MKNAGIRKLTYMAVLTAVALTIFVLEDSCPRWPPSPASSWPCQHHHGVRRVRPRPGPAADPAARVLLGSLFSGGMTIFYSLSGGLCCYAVSVLIARVLTEKQMWVCSVLGAVAHNIGQIGAAVFITRTPAIAAYLPVLMVSGILTGLFTGLCAQFLLARLKKLKK